jgi:hypothetical protein
MSEAPDAVVGSPREPVPSNWLPSGVQVRNVAFTLLSIAIVVLLLRYMQPVLLPVVLGALLFYALDPAVDRLQRLRVPRSIGAALMLSFVPPAYLPLERRREVSASAVPSGEHRWHSSPRESDSTACRARVLREYASRRARPSHRRPGVRINTVNKIEYSLSGGVQTGPEQVSRSRFLAARARFF